MDGITARTELEEIDREKRLIYEEFLARRHQLEDEREFWLASLVNGRRKGRVSRVIPHDAV